jgi:hypothetical protein
MSYTEEEIETPEGIVRMFYSKEDPSSGRLYVGEGGARACASPMVALSSIAGGFAKENKDLLRGRLKLLTVAIYICYMRRLLEHADDERDKLKIESYIHDVAFASGYDLTDSGGIDDCFFEKIVEDAFSTAFRHKGQYGAKTIYTIIKAVEEKHRCLTENENFVLRCIADAAEEAGGVPTKKSVFEMWKHERYRKDKKTFTELRDRVGFSWLPKAEGKRGKGAKGREHTSGKGWAHPQE